MKNNELKIVDLHTNFCSQNNVKVLIFKNLTGFFLHKAETHTVASCAYMRSIRLKLTYFDQNLVAKNVHLGFSGLTEFLYSELFLPNFSYKDKNYCTFLTSDFFLLKNVLMGVKR